VRVLTAEFRDLVNATSTVRVTGFTVLPEKGGNPEDKKCM
jgi:hypothetical protein